MGSGGWLSGLGLTRSSDEMEAAIQLSNSKGFRTGTKASRRAKTQNETTVHFCDTFVYENEHLETLFDDVAKTIPGNFAKRSEDIHEACVASHNPVAGTPVHVALILIMLGEPCGWHSGQPPPP